MLQNFSLDIYINIFSPFSFRFFLVGVASAAIIHHCRTWRCFGLVTGNFFFLLLFFFLSLFLAAGWNGNPAWLPSTLGCRVFSLFSWPFCLFPSSCVFINRFLLFNPIDNKQDSVLALRFIKLNLIDTTWMSGKVNSIMDRLRCATLAAIWNEAKRAIWKRIVFV